MAPLDVDQILKEASQFGKKKSSVVPWTIEDVLTDLDKAWETLRLIKSDPDFIPFIIDDNGKRELKETGELSKVYRTDVSTIKSNISRRNKLNSLLYSEKNSVYAQFYEEEKKILDAYAVTVLMDMYNINDKLMEYINELRQK